MPAPLAHHPVMGRGGVTISGARRRAAQSWWPGVDHAGGCGVVGAPEPVVPRRPPGSSLADPAIPQDSC